MCTVTFIPKSDGFLLGMNRDDLISRSLTRAPEVHNDGNRRALYPSEPEGGTWIGVNDAGLALALLNWNRPSGEKLRSRGEIIPRVLTAGNLEEARSLLHSDVVQGVLPFRLIAFSSRERMIREWRWDGRLAQIDFPWDVHHWFSSGLSDEDAALHRGDTCRAARAEDDALSLAWLRRLHRSHGRQPGPFTVCAHRETAGTLSYTDIIVAGPHTAMNYTGASPCKDQPMVGLTLP